MRPIIVFCEGSHDIAYLSRLLAATSGATPCNVPVAKLAWPFGKLFLQRLASRNADEARICGHGPVLPDEPPLLETVWELPDQSRQWFFVNCCGDCRAEQINSLLKLVTVHTQTPEPQYRLNELGVVFVNDADELTIAGRQRWIVESYAKSLISIVPKVHELSANAVLRSGAFGVGTCIFSKPESDRGALEEILAPLMRIADPMRHDLSHGLMDGFAVNGTKIGPGSSACKKLKAALTAAGQPEYPGSSLAVILRESAHLSIKALQEDVCSKRYAAVLLTV
jgi:hypothetical protein